MTALFDRPWQERLLKGDAEAALQLARGVLQPLYEHCYARLPDSRATQQVVHDTLVRAIHEIQDYDPEVHANRIWDWVVSLAAPELGGLAAPDSTPRNVSLETELGVSGESTADPRFVYRVETDLCLEARRNRDAGREQGPRAGRAARWKEVTIACPQCGHAYHISVARLGHRMRCGRCATAFDATAANVREGACEAERLCSTPVPPQPAESDLPMSVVAPPLPYELPPPKRRGAQKVPKNIARFEIREHLGSGSFGDVFRAFDPVLDREVAIKLATSAALDDERARPLVLQEPKAAAKLRHPNIVAVHDAGFDGHHFYVAIDLIDGCTLRERLRRGSLDRDAAVRLVMSLAEALDYAHRSKVLHRDVKPSNIMIDSSGQALLMDFGLARIEHSAGEQKQVEPGLLGTPGYMPPEQISRDYGEIGPHSDQYSLGAVFYQLLCGEPPFVGPEEILIANTLHTEPPRPHAHDETIDLDLEAICLKTLAKKPGDRYASCSELAEDLRRYQVDLPTRARPLGFSERLVRWCRRERALSSALGACLSLLLLFVLMLTVAVAIKIRSEGRVKESLAQTETARDDAETARDDAERSRDAARTSQRQAETSRAAAETARLEAVKNLAVTYFRHGHTFCDNGQIPQGLVYLVESLGLALQAHENDADAGSLVALIRLSLATWRCQLHELRAMLPHRLDDQDQQVECMAVDSHGCFLATVSRAENGRMMRFWDLTESAPRLSQDPIRTDEVIEAIAFTHAGHTLASVGTVPDLGCVIRMWRYSETDAAWRAEDAWLTDAQARYGAIAFSPDDTRLVAAGHDGTAGIACEWQVDTRELVFTYYQGPAVPQCVAYGPDGTCLAMGMSVPGTGGSTIAAYQVASSEMLWQDDVDGTVHDVTFSHDGNWLAAAIGSTLKGEARLWGAMTGNPINGQLTHLSEVYAVAFSPDDTFILTGSQDRSARLWDRLTGRMLGHPLWHIHEVSGVAFVARATGDAKEPLGVVTVSDAVACLWHVALGSPAAADRIGPVVLSGARVPGSEEERIVVSGTMSLVAGKTRVLKTSSFPLEESCAFQHERPAHCVAAGHDSGLVGLEDGHVLRLEWDTERLRLFPEQHAGNVLCAAMSQDGRYGATAGEDGQTLLWKMETLELTARVKRDHGVAVNALAFDPLEECVVLTAGADGQLQFWNGETGESVGAPLPHATEPLCVAYARDGLTLVVGLVGGAQIWHRESADTDWRRGARLETDSGITRAHIWPDRQLVATGDFQGHVRFWHVATGEPIGPPLANQGMITVLLGSDADVLSATSSGSIRRWPLPVTTTKSQDQLKSGVESITGVRLVQGQTVERLRVDEWQMVSTKSELSGDTDIDQTIALLRNKYTSVPRLDRVSGELQERRSLLQDMMRAFLTERPTFHTPTLEYLDRYLPHDTEALIGLDVRQVIAAPLVWSIGMSRFDLVPWSHLTTVLKNWADVSSLHPLLDVDYVLWGATRGAITLPTKEGTIATFKPGAFFGVTRGDFSFEQLRALERYWVERGLGDAQLLDGAAGRPILQLKTGQQSLPVYAALIEDVEGGTLIISASQEVVEHALAATPANRLDDDFRTCVENLDRRRSLWFAVREEVLVPAASQVLRASYIGDFLPRRIDGGLTVFVDVTFAVCATFRDDQAVQHLRENLKQYTAFWIKRLGVVVLAGEVTGTQLDVKGTVLLGAPPPPSVTASQRKAGTAIQVLPDWEERAREKARERFEEIKRKSDEHGVLSVRDDLKAFLKEYWFAAGWDDVRALQATVDGEFSAQRKLNLARLLLRRGERDTAIRVLNALVRDNPDTQAAVEARDELKTLGRGP